MRNWDSAANSDILGNPTVNEMFVHKRWIIWMQAVADQLRNQTSCVDFVQEYWDRVFMYF